MTSQPKRNYVRYKDNLEAQKQLYQFFDDLASSRRHKLLRINPLINQKKSVLHIKCQKCNTEFSVNGHAYTRAGGTASDLNQLEDGTHDFPYSCPTCKENRRKAAPQLPRFGAGEQHWNWQGGINDLSHRLSNKQDRARYHQWRQGVIQACNRTCFITGERNIEKLEAHHLESWASSVELRYEVFNGILLSTEVHRKFHSLYGSVTNTAQFEKFCTEEYGITEFPWRDNVSLAKVRNIQAKVTSEAETNHQEMLRLIEERGYVYRSGQYINRTSEYVVYCPIHDKEHTKILPRNFKRADYGVPCCVNEHHKKHAKPPSQKGRKRSEQSILKRKLTMALNKAKAVAELNDHTVLHADESNPLVYFVFYCKKHNHTETLWLSAYSDKPGGLSCCSSNLKNSLH